MASFWPTVKPDVLLTGTLVEPAGTVMIGPSGTGCHSGVLALGGLAIVALRPLPGESSAGAPGLGARAVGRGSAAGPVASWTRLPGAMPVEVLMVMVLSPAPAGIASPELKRPSR